MISGVCLSDRKSLRMRAAIKLEVRYTENLRCSMLSTTIKVVVVVKLPMSSLSSVPSRPSLTSLTQSYQKRQRRLISNPEVLHAHNLCLNAVENARRIFCLSREVGRGRGWPSG